ncbi:conserved hypothetical protein [Gammaproteobacteria bacterium]
MKTLSFSHVTFADLQKLVNIQQVVNDAIFAEWFNYVHPFNEMESFLLSELIKEHRPFILSYSEDELKMKFLAPLLNTVHFNKNGIRDWYQRSLKAIINQVIITGHVDFMVAKGVKEPESPYFFIQEFKRSRFVIDPEDQLLAEMLVAMKLNHHNLMHGAYIIGQEWRFVILCEVGLQTYEYYVSLIFDALNIVDLQRIYSNLQFIKARFCQHQT